MGCFLDLTINKKPSNILLLELRTDQLGEKRNYQLEFYVPSFYFIIYFNFIDLKKC